MRDLHLLRGSHTKRKYDEIAEQWPVACADIRGLIGERYAIERLVPGPFPGDAAAQTLRQQVRRERSGPVLDRIWRWATVQVGLPRTDFGKAVRYMLERWGGPDALRRRTAHPARQRRRGTCASRAGRLSKESLWVSLQGTEVAAAFYTLCETARLVGVDPRAYLLRAVYAAIGRPATVTFPEDLLPSTSTP